FETRRKSKRLPIHLLNDGTTSNETRLGAIRDIALAIDTFCIDDDLMVSAADDLFTFDFQSLVDAFYEKGKSIITLHPSNDPHVLRNSGNARIDARGRVFRFVEKPSHPKSNLVAPCLYILSRSTLPFISRYLNAHNDPDAPGHFLSWLVRKMTVWNFLFEESFYPLGDISSYERTQRIFKKRNA
ncbi:MAG: sugar phosphate nucleotidyltransferase, partial [bacterium]